MMKQENKITTTDNINLKNEEEPVINKPHTVNIQIEVDGEIINQELPLPPEYEPGDEVEVDIRTDRTPGDSIDEIILNVIKSPENIIEAKVNDVSKSSDEIEKEIKEMESDIARLEKENKRLRELNK